MYIHYTKMSRDSGSGIKPGQILNKFSQYLVFAYKNSVLSLELNLKVVAVSINNARNLCARTVEQKIDATPNKPAYNLEADKLPYQHNVLDKIQLNTLLQFLHLSKVL